MTATPRTLSLITYAPALTRDDLRPLAIVHGMERACAGLHLGWTISKEGQRIPLPDRDAFISRERKDGGFPLLRNGNAAFRVTVTGWQSPASSSPGGQAQLEVHADLSLDAPGVAAVDVLEAVGEGAHAFWGRVLTEGMAMAVPEQFCHPGDEPHVPPKGLPALKLPWELSTPEIPHYLGWLNYWSAAAARAIGFPDPARDAELLSRARRTASGGWVVQLTDAPLDLDNPTHLASLLRAYERFPVIGGRSAA